MTEKRELDALWWLLFDALGYAAGVDESGEGAVGRLIRPDGTEMVAGDAGSFIRFYWNIPAWLTDAGAALALCRSLGLSRNMELCFMWFPAPDDLPNTRAWFVDGRTDAEIVSAYGHGDAEALSRLALAAKRGE